MGLTNNWNSRFNSKEQVKNPKGGIEKARLKDKIQDKRGRISGRASGQVEIWTRLQEQQVVKPSVMKRKNSSTYLSWDVFWEQVDEPRLLPYFQNGNENLLPDICWEETTKCNKIVNRP